MPWEDFTGIFDKLDICETARGTTAPLALSSHQLMLSVKPTPVPGQPRVHVTHSDIVAAVRVLRAAANDEQLRETLLHELSLSCAEHELAPSQQLCAAACAAATQTVSSGSAVEATNVRRVPLPVTVTGAAAKLGRFGIESVVLQ